MTDVWREITEADERRLHKAAIRAGKALREDMRRLAEEDGRKKNTENRVGEN